MGAGCFDLDLDDEADGAGACRDVVETVFSDLSSRNVQPPSKASLLAAWMKCSTGSVVITSSKRGSRVCFVTRPTPAPTSSAV